MNMPKQRNPDIDIAAAEQLGREACRAGMIRAPIADMVYKNELLPKYLGPDEWDESVKVARRAIAVAWLRGFDRENLSTIT